MEHEAKRDNHTPKIGLECTFKPPAPRSRVKRLKRAAEDETTDVEDGAETEVARHATPPGAERSQRVYHYEPSAQASAPNTARLLPDGGGYRYVNNHLWSSLSTSGIAGSPNLAGTDSSTPSTQTAAARSTPEGRTGDSIYESAVQIGTETATGRNFLFNKPQANTGSSPADTSASLALQPQPAHIIQLWQTYLANVDPIMKVFHAPTVQQLVLGQIGGSNPAASERALVSSIYLISTVSLTDTECKTTFQESRDNLIHRFRQTTEDALSSSGFVVTNSIVVLTALVLYLASLRSLGDVQTVWSLTGLAIRIGGILGLARDGSVLDLPPFECEMRRRLWWALTYLDARTAELVGQDGDLLVCRADVRTPSNLNDSELAPSMSRLPDDRLAATEMVYVQLRAMIGKRLRALPGATGSASTWQRMRATNVQMAEKVEILSGLEKQFHDEILKYCDASVPLQYLTMNSAQSLLTKMRLIANIPIVAESSHRQPDTELSDNVYELSLRLTNLQLDLWTEPSVQKWRWHWQGQFQWYGLACLIRQTRLRKEDPEATKGWNVIRRVVSIILPSLALGQKSPLLIAIQGLLSTATGSLSQSRNQDPSSTQSKTNTYTILDPQVTHVRHGFSTGGGSTPHNAMIPSMSSIGSASMEQHDTPVYQELDDPTAGFDFNSIDWDEFDRLTDELCRQ